VETFIESCLAWNYTVEQTQRMCKSRYGATPSADLINEIWDKLEKETKT
jgi:hypothetical protein